MRIASRVALALALLLSVVTVEAAGRLALAPGDEAPPLRGWALDGERLIVDYGASRFTVINFWATWCQPCRMEMPALQKLHELHAEDGLTIYGVVQDMAGPEELQQFVSDIGVTYPTMRPWKRLKGDWGGIGSLPTTFLIDQSGRVVRRYVGATAEQITGLVYDIEARLDGRPLGPFVEPSSSGSVTDLDRPR